MPADPERHWHEASSDFAYPVDSQVSLLKDYLKVTYGRGLTGPEVEWLGNLVTDFLAWSQNNCSQREARTAGLKMIRLLSAIDEKMANSRNPERDWAEISLALGLPSVCFSHMTQAELAARQGLSKMGINKSIGKFLRRIDMKGALTSSGLAFH